MINIWEVCI